MVQDITQVMQVWHVFAVNIHSLTTPLFSTVVIMPLTFSMKLLSSFEVEPLVSELLQRCAENFGVRVTTRHRAGPGTMCTN